MKTTHILTESPLLQRIRERVPEFDPTPYLKVKSVKEITINTHKGLIDFIKDHDHLTVEHCAEAVNGYLRQSSKVAIWEFIDASKDSSKRNLESMREKSKKRIIQWLEEHGEKLDTDPGYRAPLLSVWI